MLWNLIRFQIKSIVRWLFVATLIITGTGQWLFNFVWLWESLWKLTDIDYKGGYNFNLFMYQLRLSSITMSVRYAREFEISRFDRLLKITFLFFRNDRHWKRLKATFSARKAWKFFLLFPVFPVILYNVPCSYKWMVRIWFNFYRK